MSTRSQSQDFADVDQWNTEDASELVRPHQLAKFDIMVSSRDWTVETIVRQVEQGNIDLDPAFQRRNAWRDHRRSRLVESFILGFPVPQLVLAEHLHRKGTFVVIDGKQRLLTIAGVFLSEYRDYWAEEMFSGLNVLTHLNDVALGDFLKSQKFTEERRQFSNADIRTTVVTGFKDEGVLYDIFYRINTGSVPLSSQELRQVLNRGGFARYLLEVTGEANPLWTVLNITEPDARLRDVELLLRLLALRLRPQTYRGSMKQFLDDTMTHFNGHWRQEKANVEKTVSQLFSAVEAAQEIFGAGIGRKFATDRYEGRLNRAVFEVQVFYLSYPDVRKAASKAKLKVKKASERMFRDATFLASIEATTKSFENYRIRFEKYRQVLGRTLNATVPRLSLGEHGA